jgi:hypothetical protein
LSLNYMVHILKRIRRIMITKSKGSESKFVRILAEQIVKPLISEFMSCETSTEELSEIANVLFVKRSQILPLGMKGHIIKMHQVKDDVHNKLKKDTDILSSEEHEILISKAANYIVNSLINDIVYLDDEKDESSVTLGGECRDVHGIITGSTSPPTKRKRKQTKATTENCDMDVETVDNISNLSLKVEDMEIDIEVTEDEKVLIKRSDKMDETVKAKQDRLEEEEKRRTKDKMYSEKVKNSENLIKTETLWKINKLRKQKSKTMKKRINKKKKQEMNTKSKDFFEIPNLREVPLSCQDLVNKDDLVYVVPGDGACCPNVQQHSSSMTKCLVPNCGRR